MKQLGTISSIMRYPVKSMAGEQLESTFLGFAGVLGDRAYAFVREAGIVGFPWLTIRDLENLVKFKARYKSPQAISQPADLEASIAMAPGVEPLYPPNEAYEVDVQLPDGRILPIRSDALRSYLENEMEDSLTLRFSERSMTDCRPVSLFSESSAEALASELNARVDKLRFRANFYVNWHDGGPFYENELIGATLQIGDRAKVNLTERDPRCKIITIDPETGEEDPHVLRHIANAHQGTAGVYGAVLLEGVVRAGDPIYLV